MKHTLPEKPPLASIQCVLEYIQNNWDKTVRHRPAAPNVEPVPFPYTSPCIDDNFIALFYWDTYFTNMGLLRQGRTDLATSNCNALAWLLEEKGKVPNSIFARDDTRSQPPYLAMMVWDVFKITGDTAWLSDKLTYLYEEYDFWQTQRITETGLNRHYHSASTGYRTRFYEQFGVGRLGMSAAVTPAEKLKIGTRLLAEAETGWDFTPRFSKNCPAYTPVDLNSNLAFCEKLFQEMESAIGNPPSSNNWEHKLHERKRRMDQHMWDPSSGIYRDFNWQTGQRSAIASAATFSPLWAGIASEQQAAAIRENLPLFEMQYGLAVTQTTDTPTGEQWAFPNGWPPTTWIAIEGLSRYGYTEDAQRLAWKYIDLTTRLFSSTGKLWEKYDVTIGTVAGAEYKATSMLGWSAGVYIACCNLLGLM